MDFFIDGIKDAAAIKINTITGTALGSSFVSLGSRDGLYATHDFDVNDLAAFSSSLSDSQISEWYNLGKPWDLTMSSMAASMQCWYRGGDRFGEIVGSSFRTTKNFAGPSYDLYCVGGNQIVEPRLSFGKSATFPLSTSGVSMGNVLDKSKTDAFSFAAWVKFPSSATAPVIMGKATLHGGIGPGLTGYYIAIASTGRIMWEIAGDTSNASDRLQAGFDPSFPLIQIPDEWHLIVCTYSGSASGPNQLKVYSDALSTGSYTYQGTGISSDIVNAGNFYLGNLEPSMRANAGMMAHACMYDVELTAANVTELYNNGLPPDPRTLSTAGSLEAYWPMGAEWL